MGLFSRDKTSRPEPERSDRQLRLIDVQPGALPAFTARVRALTGVLYGPDGLAIRGQIQALSESVGGIDPWSPEVLRLHPQETKRPWHWFAQACEVANGQADYAVAPHVFAFLFWWTPRQSQMSMADFGDFWLDPVPPEAARRILEATADALIHFTDDQVVVQTAGEALTAAQLRGAVELSRDA